MDTSIIIPTYNERENIARLIPLIQEVFNDYNVKGEIIIVDDNSPDKTGNLAEEFAKIYGNIRVIHRKEKLGLGSAYKTGFKEAKGKIVFEMDADHSHDPRAIPLFIEQIEKGADVVIGSRYITGGSIVGWPFQRKLISKYANLLANFILGINVKDATSGYRAYTRRALNDIDIDTIKSTGYAFQLEMAHRARKKSFKIFEIPITFVDRKTGKSKLSRTEILKFFSTVFRLKFFS